MRNKGRRAVFIGQREAIIGLIAAREEDDVAATYQIGEIFGVLNVLVIIDAKRDVDGFHAVFHERIVHGRIIFIWQVHIVVELRLGADSGLDNCNAGNLDARFMRTLRQSGNVVRRIAGGHGED